MHKIKLCLSVVGLILLTACETVHSNSACGVLIEYDKDFQNQAAEEYNTLPKDSKTRILMDDYKTTRDTIRDCMND